ncbi:hypothetical protein K1T71_015004 [Dendrolimus kikuchii]|nr:hypothetical protein K1T71_015004 [Dendrolimus kikuchii]
MERLYQFLNLPPALKCSSCEVHYVNQKAFDNHKESCEKGDWCVHCGIRYEDWEALRKHLLDHYGSNDPRVPSIYFY